MMMMFLIPFHVVNYGEFSLFATMQELLPLQKEDLLIYDEDVWLIALMQLFDSQKKG
jgi:hypothetical protein